MLRNKKFKFIKNETAREAAQALMRVARSKKIRYFNNIAAEHIYVY